MEFLHIKSAFSLWNSFENVITLFPYKQDRIYHYHKSVLVIPIELAV